MGLSIQEQLLKAGMVDKQQVKKAEHEKRIKNKKKKKGQPPSEDREQTRLKQQQAELAQQDRTLNAERHQLAQRKADQAAAKQLIKTNRLTIEEGETAYHYVDGGGKIKRILVGPDVADKLSVGRMGLAMHDGDLVLLPAETVVKILKRDKDSILAYNDPAKTKDDYPSDW